MLLLLINYIKSRLEAKFFRRKTVAGFTLIEIVITIGVFTIGVLGAFSLAIANSNNNKANKDRVIAANLAREALEITRNIRDSNWLRMDSNVICDGEICYWDDRELANKFILVDYDNYGAGAATCLASASLGECMSSCKNDDSCRLYIDSQSFYSHDNAGIGTNFYRVLGLRSICFDTIRRLENVKDVCGAVDEKIGLEVRVRIDWNRTGKSYSLELSDRFYNWRR